MRALVVVLALGAVVDCRCRTRYEPRVTAECNSFAADEIEKKRDAGTPYDLLEYKRVCEGCCSNHGLTGVDPGPCECGDLGLDVLMK
jgi:hypothetical protein